MPLTHGSNVFKATREQAAFIAECANLHHDITSVWQEAQGNSQMNSRPYDLWQDRQTGGGGCRIVWDRDIVWISCHSGYSWADITEDVAQLFREMNCPELDGADLFNAVNPFIYGYNRTRPGRRPIQ